MLSVVSGLSDGIRDMLTNQDPKFAAQLPRVVIVGGGGTGKSTILKQMLGFAVRNGRVPVWVPLAALPSDHLITASSFMDFLAIQARNQLGMDDIGNPFFESLARDGQLAIGFDALDECGSLERQQRARALIEEVAREWKHCQVFVTSRPEAFAATPLPLVKDFSKMSEKENPADEFLRFTPSVYTRDDIRPFLHAAFDDESGTLANRVLALEGIDALLDTPLTLTLVALSMTVSNGDGSPAASLTRSSVFEACIRTLCGTWDRAKPNEALEDGLSFEERVDALRRLGWAIQCGDRAKIAVEKATSVLLDAKLFDNRPKALASLNALAQRNMLLRSTFTSGPAPKLLALELAHPQFREYLAGTHLADRYLTEPSALAADMATRWFDSRWLDTLRFALTSLEENSADLREELLQLILSAEDPFRDLLHRPEFLIARLLASVRQASDNISRQIVGTLEQVGSDEPGLHDLAAELLLGCAQHCPAREALLRMANGEGLAVIGGGTIASSRSWQLRAIRGLAPVVGVAEALAFLPPPRTLEDILELAELRAGVGDYEGARALWRTCLEDYDGRKLAMVEHSMKQAGEGKTLDMWITKLPTRQLSLEELLIGIKRNVIARDAPALVQRFDRAAVALADLPDAEYFASSEIMEPVYAALQDDVGVASPSGRALLLRALWHQATSWVVAPRLGKLMPERAGEAIESLVRYIETDGSSLSTDWSRLNVAYGTICYEANDSIAVPAMLRLLQLSGHRSSRRLGRRNRDYLLTVAECLRQRGKTAEALEVVKPNLVPNANGPIGYASDVNRANWKLAFALDPGWTLHHCQTVLGQPWHEAGPKVVAERLKVSGAISIVGELFGSPWTTDAQRDVLEKAALLDSEVRFELSSGVPKARPAETGPVWTLAEAERAVTEAIQNGNYRNRVGRKMGDGSNDIGFLVATIEKLGGRAKAMALADMWVEHAAAASTNEVDALSLVNVLSTLSTNAFSKPDWLEIAAKAARARRPPDRSALIIWLSTNAVLP